MSKYTKEDIWRMIEEEDVEFIRLQFTDIFGTLKNVAVTTSHMNKSAKSRTGDAPLHLLSDFSVCCKICECLSCVQRAPPAFPAASASSAFRSKLKVFELRKIDSDEPT